MNRAACVYNDAVSIKKRVIESIARPRHLYRASALSGAVAMEARNVNCRRPTLNIKRAALLIGVVVDKFRMCNLCRRLSSGGIRAAVALIPVC